jgi:hypothetical protein
MIQKRTGPSYFLIKLMVGYSSKKIMRGAQAKFHKIVVSKREPTNYLVNIIVNIIYYYIYIYIYKIIIIQLFSKNWLLWFQDVFLVTDQDCFILPAHH